MRLLGGRPANIALATRDGSCTFEELAARAAARARGLRHLDAPIAVIEASMSIGFVASLLALLDQGHPVAVFSPAWSPEERRERLAILGRCAELGADGTPLRTWPGDPAPLHPDARLILFTTGSTGEPKAVQLSAENIESHTAAVVEAVSFPTARVQTLFLPLSYSYGLLGQLLPALAAGTTTELVERLVDAAEAFASGTAGGMVSGVPSHHVAILRLIPEGVRCGRVTHVVTAGAAAPPELRRRMQAAFPRATIYNNYGQTEASPRVLCFTSAHPRFFTPATGYPVRRLRVRLGEGGELLVRGPHVMLGYLGDPAGTADKIAGGWLHTGDLATIDEDGLVTVTGRADDLINVGGERVSLIEGEAALADVPGVRHAAAVAVEDELYGMSWVACVETSGAGVTADDVLNALRVRLAPRKMPRSVRVLPALPLTPNGKVDRRALAARMDAPAGS